MKFRQLNFPGIVEVQLEPQEDSRGFFMRVYDEKIFGENGLQTNWVQENHSLNLTKGTIRGLHFQFPPFSEGKLIRAIRGNVYDVYLDLRYGSPTIGKWGSIILSTEKKNMIFISRGFAHGFCTLTDNCELEYKMDNYFSTEHQGIIKWNDQDIGVKWPVENPIISQKDSLAQGFREFLDKYHGLKI